MDTLERLKLLARVNLNEWLKNVRDPRRELLERMNVLKAELEAGRRELAQQGASLGDYEAAETALSQQIEFHQKKAAAFAGRNDQVALEHLAQKKDLTATLQKAQAETAKFKTELRQLEITVDAVAERLGTLEKAYSRIEMVSARGEQLKVLSQVAREEKEMEELETSALRQLYTQEALLEMRGETPPQVPEEDPRLRAELEKLKQEKRR